MASVPTGESSTVVVVGSGLAGLRAAETLRTEGFRGRLVLVGAERHRPYDRPPLSKQYLAGAWGLDRLQLRSGEAFGALGLDLRLGIPAVACDPKLRTVDLADGETVGWDGLVVATGATPRTFVGIEGVPGVHVMRTVEDADRLAASLGRVVPGTGQAGGGNSGGGVASSDSRDGGSRRMAGGGGGGTGSGTAPGEGGERSTGGGGPHAGGEPGATGERRGGAGSGTGTAAGAANVERLASEAGSPATGHRVVVIGAGFIGSEVAATARGLGASVIVVEPLAAPLARALGEQVGAVCGALHQEHGVDIRTGTGARALVLADGTRLPLDAMTPVAPTAGTATTATALQRAAVVAVELSEGTQVPADTVVVGVGVVPATGWLSGSGLELRDGVVTDGTLHAADRIVVAGDIARWPARDRGATVRLEHWTNASEQGVAAARSLLAGRGEAPAFDPVPYVWSDQYDLKIQVIGVPSADDDLVVVDGDLASRRFVAVYGRHGAITGAVGFGRPRQLMTLRPLVERRATMSEAQSALSG